MMGPAISGGFGSGLGLGTLTSALGGPLGMGLSLAPMLFGGGTQVGPAAPAFNPGDPQSVGDQIPKLQPNVSGGLLGGGVTDALQSTPNYFREGSTPQPDTTADEKPNMFGEFLGGMDRGLQSPSQMVGLGMLSRLGGNSPALPLAGLLGMGLLNREGGLFNR